MKGFIQNFDLEKEPLGLEDGKHILFQCSNCNAFLADVWITQPKVDQQWTGLALCPFCGDKSFVKSWKGIFAVGGIASDNEGRVFLPKAGNEEDGKTSTVLAGFEEGENNLLIFVVRKGKDAQPVTIR